VPLLMALWFRYAFQAVATTLVVLPCAAPPSAHAPPAWQLLRGVLLLTSSLLAFLSLRYMPVGEFTAIVMITPLVITLLAATLLKEHVSPLRWTLVAGGFARHAGHHPAGRRAASAGPACCRWAGGQQRLVPGAHQQAGAHRGPGDHAPLHRLGGHAARLAGAAVRVDPLPSRGCGPRCASWA
jgi:hypothetical protein